MKEKIIKTTQKSKPSTYGWHEVPGEGKSLREEWIDSGSESGMTQDCHPEVAELQPNRSMQNLNCHPELVSGSIHRGDEGSPLTPTLSRRAREKRAAFTLTEGATHVGICANIRKNAFTLAEVLITLAIIGVVAAMTIPTLISDYQEKVTITQLTKLYSDLTNAYQLNIADGNNSRSVFRIMNYFRIVKICKNTYSGCADNSYKRLDGQNAPFGKTDSFMNNHALMQDGKIFRYYENTTEASDCVQEIKEGVASCGEFSVDINGNNGPNVIGKDVFAFYLTPTGILPIGTHGETRMSFETDCKATTGNFNGFGCTAWVLKNKNMDYLHCDDLSWDGKHKCSD